LKIVNNWNIFFVFVVNNFQCWKRVSMFAQWIESAIQFSKMLSQVQTFFIPVDFLCLMFYSLSPLTTLSLYFFSRYFCLCFYHSCSSRLSVFLWTVISNYLLLSALSLSLFLSFYYSSLSFSILLYPSLSFSLSLSLSLSLSFSLSLCSSLSINLSIYSLSFSTTTPWKFRSDEMLKFFQKKK